VFWEPRRKADIIAVAVGAYADPTFPAPSQAFYEEHRHPWVAMTQAIGRAVDERLAGTELRRRKGRVDRVKLAKAIAYFGSLPHQNEHLTDDEIIGYGPDGLPK
jgi:hypothetical protein